MRYMSPIIQFVSFCGMIAILCITCCCTENPLSENDTPGQVVVEQWFPQGYDTDILGSLLVGTGAVYGVPPYDLVFEASAGRYTFTAPGYQPLANAAGGIQAGTGNIAPVVGYGRDVQFDSAPAVIWLLCRDNLHYCRIELVEVSGDSAYVRYTLNLESNNTIF